MQDFLTGIKNLGTKAKNTVKDIFTLTDAEKAQGKKPNVLEKTTKTVGDFFAPKANEVRVRDVARELPGETLNLGKEIVKGAARAVLSGAESVVRAPAELNEYLNPSTKFHVPVMTEESMINIPGLGPIESYQNEAKRKELASEQGGVGSFLKTAGSVAVDEPLGVAFKPLGIAFGAFMKGGGKEITQEAIDSLAKSVDIDEIKNALKGFGFTKKASTELADPIAKAGTADEVKTILGYTDEAGAKIPQKTTVVNDVLANDARKYKSADDFIKANTDPLYEFKNNNTINDEYIARGTVTEAINDIGGIKNVKRGFVKPEQLKTTETVNMDSDRAEKVVNAVAEGERTPIIVGDIGNGQYEILDGHHRFEAYKALGMKDIPVIVAKDSKVESYTPEELNTIWNNLNKNTVKQSAKPVKRGMKSMAELLDNGEKPPVSRATVEVPTPEKGPERKFITRTKEMAPEIGDMLNGQYERKSNSTLVANAEKILAEDYAKAENMARTGIDDQSVAVASRMIEDELATATKATDEATKTKAYAKAAEIANDAARNLTEAGRTVQAASLLGKMTPEGMARYAARQIQKYNEEAGARTLKNFLGGAKKIPELTPEQIKEIADEMGVINKMEDGTDKARALQKLAERIQGYIPSTLFQKVLNVWKAGLLTGLKTTGINIASNLAHSVTEIAKDIPASIVDAVASLFTGKRTLVLTGKGTGKGAAEGIARGWDYLKTGFDERNIANKLDYKKVNFGKGRIADALKGYTDTVFGVLGAEDQPFYYAAKMRSMANQAAAQAKNAGLKGKEAVAFAQNLIENPTEDMLKYSTLDAETAVFQNDSVLSRGAKSIQHGLPGMEIVLPFAKTPANVAQAMINYSPVGIVKTIIENIGKGRFDQRLFSQGMGRGITGTAAMAIGAALMGNKMMNLSTPTSEKEREQWELEGRIPNSIMIDGKWRNIGVLGPLGMVLILGGHMKKGMEENGSFAGGLARAAAGFGSALTEQSFLSGVNRAIDAIKDPARSFEGFASSLAGSIIPTLVGDIARGMDTKERRTQGPMERIQSRVPGWRQGLEPQVDAFGKERETPGAFETLLDPTRPGNPSEDQNDPVLKEFRRLMDAKYPVTPTQLGDKNGYKSLTPEQNTQLWKMAGQGAREEVEKLMKGKAYKRYDDEQKSKEVARVIDDVKIEARARVVLSALKGLKGTEETARLAEMKADGLLTKSVYNMYRSLKRKK